jgi:hypothetical protein
MFDRMAGDNDRFAAEAAGQISPWAALLHEWIRRAAASSRSVRVVDARTGQHDRHDLPEEAAE